ncbi:MAG: hypothetical protein ABIA93_06995 [Candidatus Woesearchaeota archaeon]
MWIELTMACILLPTLLTITTPGTYTLCSGTYDSTIRINSDNVTLKCLDTIIVGPNETVGDGVWVQAVQLNDGWHSFGNITIEGCTFRNAMIGIGGAEVEDEGMHNTLPANGALTLRNNTFETKYSVFWCANENAVRLEGNKGMEAVILGEARIWNLGLLPILREDPTGYPNDSCPEATIQTTRPRGQKHLKLLQ